MAFPSNGAEVVSNITLPGGQIASVVMHAEMDGGDPTAVELQSLAVTVANWWDDPTGAPVSIRGNMGTNVTVEEVVCTARGLVPQLQASEDVGLAGIAAGGTVPPETAMVTTWSTGFIGRRFKGRNFWPGFADAALQDNGLWAAATVTAMALSFEALITMVDADPDWTLGVYSRLGGVITPITGVIVRNVPHHQSRRNPQAVVATFRPNKPNLWWMTGPQDVSVGGETLSWDTAVSQEGWSDTPSAVAVVPKDGHYLLSVSAQRNALGSSRGFALEPRQDGDTLGAAWSPVRAEAMWLTATVFFDAPAGAELSVFTHQLPDATYTILAGARLIIGRLGPKRWT